MATHSVSIYDPDNEVVVQLQLSDEEALRAQSDKKFATSLVQAVLNRPPNNDLNAIEDSSIEMSAPTETSTGTDSEESGSLHRWPDAAVLQLLENYRSSETLFTEGKHAHKKIWETIASQLNKKGYMMTGIQCSAKLRSLKKSYKSIKDHNHTSGNNRRTWQFFEVMDDIFAKKAWCTPVATASSTGLSSTSGASISQSNAEIVDSGSLENESLPSKKRRIAAIMETRMQQKERHAEARERRHREMMEMDNKLLSILKQLVNNNK